MRLKSPITFWLSGWLHNVTSLNNFSEFVLIRFLWAIENALDSYGT